MTSTGPSPRPEASLAGWRSWGVRSAFAPRPFSRGAISGVAAVMAIALVEVLAGDEVLVAALLVLPPLVVALTGRWGDTLLVAALALVIVLTQVVNDPPAIAARDGNDQDIGIWLALAGAALMVAGAVLSTARIAIAVEPRERGGARVVTGAEEPPPRPAPPERPRSPADEAPTVSDEPPPPPRP